MQTKTKGIVINRIKYSDSADIVSFYTRNFGRVSYLVYRSKSKKSANRLALLQPLSILEMEVNHLPKRDIHRIIELRPAIPFADIPFNPIKNSIALFVTEVINKVMLHSEEDETMYCFLENVVCRLDSCEAGIPNFHLVFLVEFLKQLGVNPSLENAKYCNYFDLINGFFTEQHPEHVAFLQKDDVALFALILETDFDTMEELKLDRSKRVKALNMLVEYCKIQLPDFKKLNSLDILHDLWS